MTSTLPELLGAPPQVRTHSEEREALQKRFLVSKVKKEEEEELVGAVTISLTHSLGMYVDGNTLAWLVQGHRISTQHC